MTRHHLLAYAATGALALCGTTTAHAASPATALQLHVISRGDEQIAVAGGDRVVLPGAQVRVRDDRTDHVSTLPANCNTAVLADAAGFARCGERWFTYTPATGLGAPIALTPPETLGSDFGTQWVLVGIDGGNEYLNWHTGARSPALLSSGNPTQDSDSATLAPLKPRLQGSTVLAVQSRRPIPLTKPLKTLRLRVAGQTRTVRRCASQQGCSQLQYDRGVLSFADGNRAYAYRTRDRRLFQTSIPAALARTLQVVPQELQVTHTARRLYLGTRRDTTEPTNARQYASFSAVIPRER